MQKTFHDGSTRASSSSIAIGSELVPLIARQVMSKYVFDTNKQRVKVTVISTKNIGHVDVTLDQSECQRSFHRGRDEKTIFMGCKFFQPACSVTNARTTSEFSVALGFDDKLSCFMATWSKRKSDDATLELELEGASGLSTTSGKTDLQKRSWRVFFHGLGACRATGAPAVKVPKILGLAGGSAEACLSGDHHAVAEPHRIDTAEYF